MMYFVHTVRTPEDHVVRVMNKDTVYVYWEKSLEYIGENKYTAPRGCASVRRILPHPTSCPPTATSCCISPERGCMRKRVLLKDAVHSESSCIW